MKQTSLFRSDDVRIREIELEPGEAGPWHRHSQVTDFIWTLGGVIAVDRRGRPPLRLEQGDRARVEVGDLHRVANAASAASTYLLVQVGGAYDFIESPGTLGTTGMNAESNVTRRR